MSNPPEQFHFLAQQFESLVNRLNACPTAEERRQLLKRMKVLIVEIDILIASSLKRDPSLPSDQFRADV
jgi:hypothetical protein